MYNNLYDQDFRKTTNRKEFLSTSPKTTLLSLEKQIKRFIHID
jgi:hypothetical protein